MSRLWVFKNLGNFTITVLGVSGVGLILRSVQNERVFSSSPVVTEGIKIAGLNPTIKELLGFPLSYSGSYSNSYHFSEDDLYFTFQVKGPRGNTNVELEANQKPLKDILLQRNQILDLKGKIQSQKEQSEKLSSQIKNRRRGVDINEKKKEKELIDSRIEQLMSEQNKLSQKYKQELKTYYIPNEELYIKVNRNKTPEQVVLAEQKVYGIKALAITLPNRSRISIIPQEEGVEKNQQILHKLLEPEDHITQGYLRERLREGMSDLTEEELASYSRHKTNAMYGKHNNYRVMFFIGASIAFTLFVIYYHRFKLKPLSGTMIAAEAQKYFFTHEKFKEILPKLKEKKNLKWNKTIAGGQKSTDFSCTAYIDGFPGSKIHFSGKREEDSGKNVYSEFVLQFQEKGKTKKIDFLQ